MNTIGKLVCIVGTLAAVLYPPYTILGQRRWDFVWEDIVAAFGQSVPVYEHIDIDTLLLEVVAVNVVGVALILVGSRR